MEAEYIVMIVVGSVVVLLLLIYMAVAIEAKSSKLSFKRKLAYYYSSENLAKMEYDLAIYRGNKGDNGGQMTIDEVINNKQGEVSAGLSDLYTPMDDAGLGVIKGNYNPDTD